MKEKGLLLESEHSVTRLQRLNLTNSQQRDAVTYEPGQIVEFHRMAKGVVRRGVPEKRFKSDEQWESFAASRELSSSEGRRREAVATRPNTEVQCVRARAVDGKSDTPILIGE